MEELRESASMGPLQDTQRVHSAEDTRQLRLQAARLPSDADEPDEDAADVSPRTSLRFRETTKKDKDT